MTTRLPIPGSDNDTWGAILNGFLQVAHNSDGTLQSSAIQSAGGITSSQVGVVNGVASLNGSGQVPVTQLASGTGSGSNYLRGDGTWAVPSGSGGVASFNTRTGAVAPQSGDYTFSQVGASQSLTPTAVKTSAYTANSGDFIPVDTSGGSVTITLPTAPADKSRVEVKMVNTSGGNTVTINTGGSDVFNKSGGVTAGTLSLLNQALMVQYASSGGIWYVQSDDLPLSQLDGRYAAAVKPYQFSVATYGAKGDGKIITDAVMTSNSANLACTTSTPFTSADVGKHILVSTAAGSYAHLHSTIGTFTDSGHVVLANNATANTGGTPGAIAYYGTDDTAAIQNTINAATTYAQAHNGYAEILFDDLIYIIAGGFNTGSSTGAGNNQISLPIISPTTGVQVVLAFKGAMETTPLMHWTQVTPQAVGTILASVRTDGTSDTGSGPSSVIGGPVNGYGGEPGTFSNALIRVSGIGMLVPYNASMSGLDLFGMVEADVSSFSCMTAAVVPTSSAPAPSLSSTNNITKQYTFGLRMPDTGNQVVCRVGQFSSEGMCYGLVPSEWTYGEDIHVMYAIVAVAPWGNSSGIMAHSAYLVHVQAENCYNAVGNSNTGTCRMDIADLQVESLHGTLIYDHSSKLQGTYHVRSLGTAENYVTGGFLDNSQGGAQLRLINELTYPGLISPSPSIPASGTAYPNYWYRDTSVYISGGVVSAVAVDGATLNGITSGHVRVPSGHTITLTYSSAPSWQWVMD